MSHTITQSLNEQLRDAMLGFYLNSVLPEDPAAADSVKTVDDVYAYWLLDPQVSHAVPTTRIASAIASLQQYINGIYLGLEPGYETQGMSADQQTEWRDQLLSYSLWRANQQLQHYPASYLSPTLRHDKSDSFNQLENQLNQFRIEPAPLLKAVHNYLSRFEELATVKTLNGYIDGDKDSFASSVYYFIGKSSAHNTYYWRTLDMARHAAPDRAAWSGWNQIPLSIDDNVPEHTIRPVVFNGRLFVVWAQCINPTSSSRDITPFGRGDVESDKDYQQRLETRIKTTYLQFRLYFSYKKLDDSWSSPQICIQEYSLARDLDDLSSEDLMNATATIAVLDSKTQPPSLFLGLSAEPNHQPPSPHNGLHRHFFQAVRLDQHFNIHWLETLGSTRRMFAWHKDAELAGRYLALFGHHNKSNFQFRAPKTIQVKVQSLINSAPHANANGWNYENHQAHIRDLSADNDIKFNRTTSVLEVTTRLNKRFEPHRTVRFSKADALVNLTITLSTSGSSLHNSTLTLGPTSEIFLEGAKLATFSKVRIDLALKCNETGVSYAQFIKDEKNQPAIFTLPQIDKDEENPKSTTFKLNGKHITEEAFEYFFNTPNATYTATVSFYNNQAESNSHAYDLLLDKVQVQQKQRRYKPVLMYPKQGDVTSPESPHRNNTVLVGLADASRRNLRDTFTELPETHTLEAQIQLSPKTLQPYDQDVTKTPVSSLTLIYGVLLLESDVHYPDPIILGYALKTATFNSPDDKSAPIIPLAPFIGRLPTSPYGTAEFIDFSSASIKHEGKPEVTRAPIRTNTCVAGLLTKTAGAGLHQLFALASDAWHEPPLPGAKDPSPLDFQGPHGAYYWELFLYLPWLLAHRLNQEQQYGEAETWLRHLFDPTQPSTHWRLPALLASAPRPDYASPRPLAISNAVHFRQALYLLYVDILFNRGDAAYRQMTRDGLAEAKLWYIRAKGLLGPRPPFNLADPWVTTTLDNVQDPSTLDSSTLPTGTSRLCRSLSPDLLMRWDKIEARLYNLRHHLDLTGKPLSLPLYAATLSPQTLLAAYQQGAVGTSLRPSLRTAQAGHYRFQVLLEHALQAVDNLIQLGTTLLSLVERKEQAQYLETQQQQAWDLARLAIEQQAQAVQFDARNKQALQAGRRIVEARVAFFEQQLKRGISPAEAQATQEYQDSARWDTAAAVAQAGAGLAMLIPNIFGTSNGGVRYEGAFHALHAASQGIANEKRANAAHLDRVDLFARRAAEWAHSLDQARLELAQVDDQLQAYTEQETHTRLQLRLAQTSFTHARTLYDQLGKRFSNAQLYQWLNGQLSTFYYQAYDSTLSLCLAAEACWQEERAQWDRHFIQTRLWTQQYRGFSAGEALKLNLLSMSSAYVTQNERVLEITKTVSLRQLHSKDPLATGDKPWATLKADLVKTGTLAFELTLKLFDDDYPGHYLRRIKNLSVSLPATLGPYEDVKAILTQTANTTYLAPATTQSDTVVKKDLRAKQQIALSSGLNDSGLFTLNFDSDERYLPFEYTGAISSWQLTFPNHTRQNALLESLTDIIVHLRYTAKHSAGPQ